MSLFLHAGLLSDPHEKKNSLSSKLFFLPSSLFPLSHFKFFSPLLLSLLFIFPHPLTLSPYSLPHSFFSPPLPLPTPPLGGSDGGRSGRMLLGFSSSTAGREWGRETCAGWREAPPPPPGENAVGGRRGTSGSGSPLSLQVRMWPLLRLACMRIQRWRSGSGLGNGGADLARPHAKIDFGQTEKKSICIHHSALVLNKPLYKELILHPRSILPCG